jgi:hypothetical protein
MYNTHSLEIIKGNLKKYKPIKYNRFMWWRRYKSPNEPLHKKNSLIDKIRNGDFDFSHYFWETQLCEYELNVKRYNTPDLIKWVEDSKIDRIRRKKLIEDFLKDENEKLLNLEKSFIKEFGISREKYYLEIDQFDGTIEEFYFHLKNKLKYESFS